MSKPGSSRNRLRHIIRRDGNNCWLCGEPMLPISDECFRPGGSIPDRAPTVDHVVERRNGGTSHLSNLRAAHRACNNERDSRHAHTAGPKAPECVSGFLHTQQKQRERNVAGEPMWDPDPPHPDEAWVHYDAALERWLENTGA